MVTPTPDKSVDAQSAGMTSAAGPGPRLGRLAGALPIPIFIGLTIASFLSGSKMVFEPPGLLLILNIIFGAALPLAVALVAARAYLRGGPVGLLLLGCGTLTVCLAAVLAGIVIGVTDGPNAAVTIHDTGALLASVFHFTVAASITLGLAGQGERKRGILRVLLPYLAISVVMGLLTFLAVRGVLPVFFVQPVGVTLLDGVVLGVASTLLLVAGGFFGALYFRTRTSFFYWYSLALVLFAVGLICVLLQASVGSLLGWTGRSAKYLGGVYFLMAILAAARESRASDMGLNQTIAGFFRRHLDRLVDERTVALAEANEALRRDITDRKRAAEALRVSERKLLAFMESATEGFVIYDSDLNLLSINKTALEICPAGSTEENLRGKHMLDLAPGLKETGRYDEYVKVVKTGEPLFFDDIVPDPRFGDRRLSVHAFRAGDSLGIIFTDITDRKRAERTLQESEEKYRTIAETIPGILYRCAADWTFLFATDAIEELTGFPASDFISNKVRSYESIMNEDDTKIIEKTVNRAIRKKQPFYSVEYRIEHKDGSIKWVYDSVRISYKRDGEVDYFEGVILDITERKRAEQSLQEAEAELKHTIEVVPNIIATANAHTGYFTHCNPALSSILGFSSEEFLARPFIEFIHPDDRQSTIDTVEEQLKGSPVARFENRYICKDGSYKWLEWRATATDEKGVVYAAATDITDRKRAQDGLKKQSYFLSRAQEIGHIGTWELDIAKNELLWTDENYRIFGIPAGTELTYEIFLNCSHPDDREYVDAKWKAAMAGEPYDIEHRLLVDGEVKWVREKAELEFDDEGNCIRGTGFTQDITERKQAEAELTKHRDHLEELVRERTAVIEAQGEQVLEASRLKSEFLATMSHELRTPLNSIMALSQLMLSGGTGKDPDKEAEFLGVIERNGRNFLNLINDILDLSSVEAGRTIVRPSEFALGRIMKRILSTVCPMAEAKGLRLEVDLSDIPSMYSDQDRIEQILLNLLSNAVKFTEAGQVTVTASESGGTISLSVADTGIGISSDVLPHVFERFRQADGSNTRKYEGTGLGLAISQGLAELLGGEITATSEVGKGSTFALRIPVRMADVVQAEDKDSPPGAGVTGAADADLVRSTADRDSTGAILVVEDNADNLLATTATLEHLGYQCITAVNGELALVAARTHAPALILMDIQLPEMDGLEATRQLKADPALKDIPIVALTAKAMKGDREDILAVGCDDYMSKPINPAELGRLLRKWLG